MQNLLTYQPSPPPPMEPPAVTLHAYGMVGTGRTREEAKRDLFEKIRQAGER